MCLKAKEEIKIESEVESAARSFADTMSSLS